jgi:hypothetical protein
MKQKALLFIVFSLLYCLPSRSVLKEKDLDNTLSILRLELKEYHDDLERQSGFFKFQNEQVFEQTRSILNKSNQNSLMLYSQKPDYIFDLTYACHEATEQYRLFQKNVMPFRSIIDRINGEIARYDSLITNLSQMPKMMLSEQAKIDRNVCLTLAVNIRRTLNANSDQLYEYVRYYEQTELRLKYLNDYANKRYKEIQTNIFKNGGDNYMKILSNLSTELQATSNIIFDKYRPMRPTHS